jgi:hypothetical protein
VNDDIAPKLTVVKVLIPDGDPGWFDLYIDDDKIAGPVKDYDSGPIEVTANVAHTVSEQGADGTNLSHYLVEYSGHCDENGVITLGLDEDGTCTITNRGADIKLYKTVSDSPDDPGDDEITVLVGTELYYHFAVKNTGGVTLTHTTVTDTTLADWLGVSPETVFCTIDVDLAPGETYADCPSVGPITAAFTGAEHPARNVAWAHGCYEGEICAEDDDSAAYYGLYWAFTPGFWKNHYGNPNRPNQNDAFKYTAYTWTTSVGDVFDALNASPYSEWLLNGEDTNLVQALQLRVPKPKDGDWEAKSAARILLRHATASVLNASFHEVMDVDGHPVAIIVLGDPCELQGPNGTCYYPYASETIIDLVNAALASLDPEAMLALAEELDSYNNGIHEVNWDWLAP